MTVELHIETNGVGADVVLLHGWGMHGSAWQEVASRIQTRFRVHNVDLPGHGYSYDCPTPYTLETVAGAVVQALQGRLTTSRAHWIGWSLGGMLALKVAMAQPQQVERLVMVAASPRFTRAPDWPNAVDPQILQQFAGDLAQDYKMTLQRFIALQMRGAEDSKNGVRALRADLFTRGEPQAAALQGGLEILASADLRTGLMEVTHPVLLLGGQRDTLVPVAALQQTAQRLSRAKLEILKGAGHAPFISHPELFVKKVQEFLDDRA